MSKKRSNEPFLWLLFSAGGVVAAMVIPIHLFLFALAFPIRQGHMEPMLIAGMNF